MNEYSHRIFTSTHSSYFAQGVGSRIVRSGGARIAPASHGNHFIHVYAVRDRVFAGNYICLQVLRHFTNSCYGESGLYMLWNTNDTSAHLGYDLILMTALFHWLPPAHEQHHPLVLSCRLWRTYTRSQSPTECQV